MWSWSFSTLIVKDNISIHVDHIDTGIYSAPRHTKIPKITPREWYTGHLIK